MNLRLKRKPESLVLFPPIRSMFRRAEREEKRALGLSRSRRRIFVFIDCDLSIIFLYTSTNSVDRVEPEDGRITVLADGLACYVILDDGHAPLRGSL